MLRPWAVGTLCAFTDEEIRQVVKGLDVRVLAPRATNAESVTAVVQACELLLCGIGPLLPTAADIASARYLAFGQKLGSGVDSYDLLAFDRAEVAFSNMPDATAPAIAEWCLATALALTRRLLSVDTAIRAGAWPHQKMRELGVRELGSLRVGIVGMGAIGKQCASLFSAMGSTVRYFTRSRNLSLESSLGMEFLSLSDLCERSDVLIVALSLTPQTEGFIDRSHLMLLPRGAYVINAARGRLIDEDALIELLDEGRLGGAALDVFETEPLPADSPLRRLRNTILFPHSSADSPQTRQRLFQLANDNLRRAITGEDVHWVVNSASARIRRRADSPIHFDDDLVMELHL